MGDTVATSSTKKPVVPDVSCVGRKNNEIFTDRRGNVWQIQMDLDTKKLYPVLIRIADPPRRQYPGHQHGVRRSLLK